MLFVLSLGFSPFSWCSKDVKRCWECLLNMLNQFLTFPKCVYLCCPGLFARALSWDGFSGLSQLQVIKKKRQQNLPKLIPPSPLHPQHLTVPRLCGFCLHVLLAYWAGEGDNGKYHCLVFKSCWVRSLISASEVLLEMFRTVTTTSLVEFFLFQKSFPFLNFGWKTLIREIQVSAKCSRLLNHAAESKCWDIPLPFG